MRSIGSSFLAFVLLASLGGFSAHADGTPRLDVVVLAGGSEVQGVVEQDDATGVVVRRRSSSGGVTRVTLTRKQIREIRYGAGEPIPVAPGTAAPGIAEGSPDGGTSVAPPPAESPKQKQQLRSEWFLLRSGGRLVGTRHLSVTVTRGGRQAGWRFVDERRFLAQGKHVPASRITHTEVTDLELRLRRTIFEERVEGATSRDFNVMTTGVVKDGVWTGRTVEGGRNPEPVELAVGDAPMGPLAFRETLLQQQPRKVGIYEQRVLDLAKSRLRDIRAGFVALGAGALARGGGSTTMPNAKGDEFHWVDGEQRLITWYDGGGNVKREALSDSVEAIPATKAQAEAAFASGGEDAQAVIKLPEVGLSFRLPDPGWVWKPKVASVDPGSGRDLGWLREAGSKTSGLLEWHPEGAQKREGPAAARDWLLARMRRACRDLQLLSDLRPLDGFEDGWRLEVTGTLKGDTPVRSVAVLIDRGAGRFVMLLACPEVAWLEQREAVEAILDSLTLL